MAAFVKERGKNTKTLSQILLLPTYGSPGPPSVSDCGQPVDSFRPEAPTFMDGTPNIITLKFINNSQSHYHTSLCDIGVGIVFMPPFNV